MENIFKVKVQTNPDPRWLYPSERRYSASIVLGLGVVHLSFALVSLLMASLTITSSTMDTGGAHNETDDSFTNNTKYSERIDSSTSLTLGPCLMCIGALGAGLTALLAWKRWYMDHNICWFFLMSIVSTTTSIICLVLVIVLIIITNSKAMRHPNTKDMITINILIASALEAIWSTLSVKVSFSGMKNNYPDDIVIPKMGGKVEVNTIHRGNLKGQVVPPDILSHYCGNVKIPKHLQKKTNGNLPNDESNAEYYERVNKFLTSDVDTNSSASLNEKRSSNKQNDFTG